MGTTSQCAGACAAAWPPLRATGKPVVGTSLSASKIGTTARSDGKPQVTYNGHPLYLYSADQKPGDTNGQGLNAFGGAWFALSVGGNMVSGRGSGSGLGY
jgi:predicted lipoprotein with Yx(FWY)xxD motif